MIKHPVDDIRNMKDGAPTAIQAALACLGIPIELYEEKYALPLVCKRKISKSVQLSMEEDISVKKDQDNDGWKKMYRNWVQKEIENFADNENFRSVYCGQNSEVERWFLSSPWCVNVSVHQYQHVLEKLSQLYFRERVPGSDSEIICCSFRKHLTRLMGYLDEYIAYAERIEVEKKRNSLFQKFDSVLGNLLDVEYSVEDIDFQ